jgi:hypothetical protein
MVLGALGLVLAQVEEQREAADAGTGAGRLSVDALLTRGRTTREREPVAA